MKSFSKKRLIRHPKTLTSAFNEGAVMLSIPSHPFIVGMHRCFHDEVNAHIVMDLCEGGDMRQLVNQKGRLSEASLKFYMGCALLALEAMHSRRIIHRDIKPENLYLDSEVSRAPAICERST